MINTTNWKEFRVGDLFNHIGKTAVIDPASKRPYKDETYSVPALSSTVINNSFGYYANPKEHNIIDRCCLSVTSNGDAGKVYFQNQPFVIAQDAYVIYLKDDDRENVYLFMACVLEKLLMPKYSYTNKASWNKVKKEIITLPAKNDKPDFDYMEEYIEEIKLKYIDRLEKDNNENIDKALRVTGLSYADLNKDLTVKPADRYEEFRVGDLFNGISGDTDIKQHHINDKGLPVITSGLSNNGLLGLSDVKAKVISQNTITVDMFGNAFYRNYNYKMVTHARVFALKPKFNITDNIGLYFATMFFYLSKKFDYSNMCSYEKIKNNIIVLPAIDKDTPDFDYMEKAIYIYYKED